MQRSGNKSKQNSEKPDMISRSTSQRMPQLSTMPKLLWHFRLELVRILFIPGDFQVVELRL